MVYLSHNFNRLTGRTCLMDMELVKMVYLIGPDGLVNRRVANFHKMVWIPSVYRYAEYHQVLSRIAS